MFKVDQIPQRIETITSMQLNKILNFWEVLSALKNDLWVNFSNDSLHVLIYQNVILFALYAFGSNKLFR